MRIFSVARLSQPKRLRRSRQGQVDEVKKQFFNVKLSGESQYLKRNTPKSDKIENSFFGDWSEITGRRTDVLLFLESLQSYSGKSSKVTGYQRFRIDSHVNKKCLKY